MEGACLPACLSARPPSPVLPSLTVLLPPAPHPFFSCNHLQVNLGPRRQGTGEEAAEVQVRFFKTGMPALRAPGITCPNAPTVFARAVACTVGSVLYQEVLTEAEGLSGGEWGMHCPALRCLGAPGIPL